MSEERYVVDGNRVTGGGVTSGIDFGLKLAAMLRSETEAKQIEYNPAPPFDAGTPQLAGEEIERAVRLRAASLQELRRATVERVKSRLS
jgi:cyclohexyl-isocyanide hydratase